MCNNCYDDEPAAAFRQIMRTARKEHRCEECGSGIKVGARYEYTSGIWDGSPSDYKTCARCTLLRAAHIVAEYNTTGEHCYPLIGELIASIGECSREEPVYVAAFRKARRSLLAGTKPERTGPPTPGARGDVLMGSR